MTISRRDTLRFAAALAATRVATFAVSPEEAAAMLAQPATHDMFTVDTEPWQADTVDPVTFAVELESTDFGFSHGSANGAAAEWAAYKQALDAVIAVAPERLDVSGINPASELDEAVVAMGNAMWRAGVVAGAAYEHLRLALSAPLKVCNCNGHGCETCDGRGTLAAMAPDLPFFAAD